MDRLTKPMQEVIRNFSAGAVATINADGSPSVSPKATFIIVDNNCLAFGNIRSQGTCANLRERPRVEVCFTDILARVAVRVTGHAKIIAKDTAKGQALAVQFEQHWSAYIAAMENFVQITVDRAEMIMSPAYDVGLSRQELITSNLEKLNKMA